MLSSKRKRIAVGAVIVPMAVQNRRSKPMKVEEKRMVKKLDNLFKTVDVAKWWKE